MSYILDALRKADAERSRGSVPGLASQPLPATMAGPLATRAGRPGWTWAAGGAAAALALVLLAWGPWERQGMPAAEPARPASLPAAGAAAPAVPDQARAPVVQVLTLPVAPPPPQPVPVPVPAPAAVEAPAAAAVSPPASTPLARQATADPAQGPVPALAELPPTVRRQLPPLVVGGSVWSEQPSSRFVMLDGQLLREGDALGPGLVVERIGPRSARLAWREKRFEVRW
jgi:general secretion pathway protein B